jgi:L-ascorbate metabolism protein UlaG (beta-lactamase superfamily)
MADRQGGVAWLGHATVIIELDGVRLLTDPLLHRTAAHLRRFGTPVPVVPPTIDAVLVSHVHWDHLDLRSLDLLGRDVHVVVPRGAGRLLERRGFADVTEVEESDEVTVGAVAVQAVHAEHKAGRGLFGVNAPALGYVVAGTQRVYFAGDTDRFDEMARLAPGLDVALLPVAGWGARIPAGHMDAGRAAESLLLLQPRIAIPVHWATFAPLHRLRPYDRDAGERFAACARLVAPAVDVRVLRVGERCAF